MHKIFTLAGAALLLAAGAGFGVAADLSDTVDKHLSAGARLLDKVEARVNNDYITTRELEERVQVAAVELRRDPDEALRRIVLRQMIEDLLLLQLARKESIVIPEDQIRTQVERMVAARIARYPSEEDFWKVLEQSRISPEAYREDLTETVRRGAVIRRMELRLAQEVVVTPEDVEKYKQANPTAAQGQEKLVAGMIQLALPANDDEAEVERVMLRAATLKTRLDAGESFDRLAREYSVHSSREAGGEIGEIERGDVPELDFLFDHEPGFTSEPIRASSNVRIYRVLTRQTLAEAVHRQKAEEQRKKLLDELKTEAIIELRGQRVEYF